MRFPKETKAKIGVQISTAACGIAVRKVFLSRITNQASRLRDDFLHALSYQQKQHMN